MEVIEGHAGILIFFFKKIYMLGPFVKKVMVVYFILLVSGPLLVNFFFIEYARELHIFVLR